MPRGHGAGRVSTSAISVQPTLAGSTGAATPITAAWTQRRPLRLVSVRFSGVEEKGSQLEMFGQTDEKKRRLAAVMDGLRERGLLDTDGRFTDAGRETKQRIEALTDELAAPPYDALSPAELDELVAELEPITATLVAAGSH